jgi:hypothetical protein
MESLLDPDHGGGPLGIVLHYVARERAIAAGRKINRPGKQFGDVATAIMPQRSIKKSAQQTAGPT